MRMRICIERQTFSLDSQLELFQSFSREDFLLISQKTRCLLCNHQDKTENTTGNRLEKLSALLHVGKVSALCMHKTLLDLLCSVLLQPKVMSLLLPVLIFKSVETAKLKMESLEITRKHMTFASERKYFSIHVKLLLPIPLIHSCFPQHSLAFFTIPFCLSSFVRYTHRAFCVFVNSFLIFTGRFHRHFIRCIFVIGCCWNSTDATSEIWGFNREEVGRKRDGKGLVISELLGSGAYTACIYCKD